jgi:hypothetical protein
MKDLKNSIREAISFQEHDKILKDFALGEFIKKYPPSKSGTSIWFNGYEVIDENTIRINYQYGGGDMEMDSHWDVEIV